MTSLQKFEFGDKKVRKITVDGEPWFVASDICKGLGHSNPSTAVAGLDDDAKGLRKVATLGGSQEMMCVSEPGLWRLLGRSKKPSARPFQRWLTHEVLPSIRRTGHYGFPTQSTGLDLSNINAVQLQLAEAVIAQHRRAEVAEAQLAIAAPMVASYQTFLGANGDDSVRQAAQLLHNEYGISIGEHRLFDWLRNQGWIGHRDNQPYQHRVTAGLLTTKASTHMVTHRDGSRRLAAPQVRVTPKGLDRIRRSLTGPTPAPAITSAASKPRKRRPLSR